MQRAMINAAGRVLFCVDSSKLGRQSISKLCDLDTIDILITDSGAPADFLEMLRRRNVQVIVAPVEPPPPPVSPPPEPPPKPKPAAKPPSKRSPVAARAPRVPSPRKSKRAAKNESPVEEENPDSTGPEGMPVHFL